jgi:lipopolysaccharide export system permease protein
MSLLQRTILFDLLRIFVMVLGGFTVLMVFVGVFREASEHGLGPLQIMQILPYIVPSLLPFTIPATMLLTVSAVYGRMAGDQEIIAAKAAGIHVMALITPSLMLGLVLSASSLFLTDKVIPWASHNIKSIVINALETIFLEKLKTELQFVDRKFGIAITVAGVEGNNLIRPTFSYSPKGKSTITVQAEMARLEFDLNHQQILLHVTHGMVNTPNGQNLWIENEDFPLPLPGQNKKIRPGDMTIQQMITEQENLHQTYEQMIETKAIETSFALTLGEYHRLQEPHFERMNSQQEDAFVYNNKMHTESNSRVALAWSCLAFVWVGSPFSILKGERQFLKSFFICFVPIILVYYPLMLLIINQSSTGRLEAWWAVWIPNAIMLVAGAYFMYRVRKH